MIQHSSKNMINLDSSDEEVIENSRYELNDLESTPGKTVESL